MRADEREHNKHTGDQHEVRPNLWLGSYVAATDPEIARHRGITHVLSIAIGVESLQGFRTWLDRAPAVVEEPVRRYFDPTADDPFTRLVISEDDHPASDVKRHFEAASTFIAAGLAGGHGVLVHCMAGASRSASLVTAYLMKTEHLSASAALAAVAKWRPIVDPNPGFRDQLRDYEADLGLAPAVTRPPQPWNVETRAERLEALAQRVEDIAYVQGEEAAADKLNGVARERNRGKLCVLEAQLDAVDVTGSEVLKARRRELGERCRQLMGEA